MTDLEMTRLCAEAMEIHWVSATDGFGNGSVMELAAGKPGTSYSLYDPLHDDAQAMALVKKFGLEISSWGEWTVRGWGIVIGYDEKKYCFPATHRTDLNRAIVECVAKMQAAKK